MSAATRPRALVTGASAGIGEAFARHLADRNYDLVLVARRRQRLRRLAKELTDSRGVAVEVVQADLLRERDVAALEERLRGGDIDLLVNNAGLGTVGDFVDLPLARELEELDVNVRALFRLTHAALSAMVPRGAGTIINVASTAAFQAIPHNATYAATKAFVLHFSEAVHEEVRDRGVTVTCVCPGPVKTEFLDVAEIDGHRVPEAIWVDVDTVVQSALAGAQAGRAIVIPGVLNRVSAASAQLAPRMLTRQVAGAIFKRVQRRPREG